MKKTATKYLFEKLWEIPKDKFTWQMILQEAKKMEKEQIEEAFVKGEENIDQYGCYENPNLSEQYYKENYEQK